MNKYIRFFKNIFKIKNENKCRIRLEDLSENEIFLCRNRLNPSIESIGRFIEHDFEKGYAKVIWLVEGEDSCKIDRFLYSDTRVMEVFRLV